jgi:hypothetical protein
MNTTMRIPSQGLGFAPFGYSRGRDSAPTPAMRQRYLFDTSLPIGKRAVCEGINLSEQEIPVIVDRRARSYYPIDEHSYDGNVHQLRNSSHRGAPSTPCLTMPQPS